MISSIYLRSFLPELFAYDYALRCRLGRFELSYSVIAETPFYPLSS